MMIHQKTSTSAGLAIASAFFLLTACQPQTPAVETPAAPVETATAPAAADGCTAKVERPWGTGGYRVKAWTSGETCEAAVVTLAAYGSDGLPIYGWAGAAQFLFLLNDVKTPEQMQTGLNEWVGGDNLEPDLTGTLPPWEETEGQPKRAEFPFMPNMEKDAYEALRQSNLNMLCYPQGMESQLCLALHPSEGGAPAMVEEIGLQLFPG
ncbi:MAG: hypothetical protein EON93_05355 [Burkholderiales bacterium]|nr:MAG: hypothetical protein EON93_05355 [Burkholderiales bacterium]